MTDWLYRSPGGTIEDKRKWPKGTLVYATLTGGSVLQTRTACEPRRFGTGGWGVRVDGAPYMLALERVSPRFQVDLLADELEGTSESEKQTPSATGGRRAG